MVRRNRRQVVLCCFHAMDWRKHRWVWTVKVNSEISAARAFSLWIFHEDFVSEQRFTFPKSPGRGCFISFHTIPTFTLKESQFHPVWFAKISVRHKNYVTWRLPGSIWWQEATPLVTLCQVSVYWTGWRNTICSVFSAGSGVTAVQAASLAEIPRAHYWDAFLLAIIN